jgi:hypothetical protein
LVYANKKCGGRKTARHTRKQEEEKNPSTEMNSGLAEWLK